MLEEFEIYKTDSQLAYGGVIIKYSFMNILTKLQGWKIKCRVCS